MRIGLDLDGTVYAHPRFFGDLIRGLSPLGYRFLCISSHGRHEWPDDCVRLAALNVPAELISPELMHHSRHGELAIKGRAADQCDLVFDDDARLRDYTSTPVLVPTCRSS